MRHCLMIGSCLLFGLVLGACAPKKVLRQPEPTAPTGVRERPADTSASTERPGRPEGVTERSERAEGSMSKAVQAAELALAQQGRPYRWGGHSPERGFDCSGLVMWSYGCVGVDLPRVVNAQHQAGRDVHGRPLLPGDLVFFALDGRRVSHVGLVVDDERFVHAPRRGRPVRIDELDDPYWRTRWVATRRITGN